MSDKETLAVYDAKIEDYKSLTFGSTPKALLRFIEALPENAHALDLGCGPGFAAADMARRGVARVTAMDASTEMVKTAATHEGVTTIQATYDDLPNTPTYHGIYANFALLHSTRDDFKRQIADCQTALHPNGILHLGMKTGTGEKRDHLGRFYTYYTVEELSEILGNNDFTITFVHEGEEKGLAGPTEPFVVISACRT